MLVTRDTMNQIAGYEEEFNYRFIGMIQAAGVNEVVGAFDILDALPTNTRKRRMATKLVFESGVRRFHTKEYKTACARFEQVVNADPTDACAANALAEARKRLENPTLPSIFVFEKK
jgi:Tfp pilus assembly protein PilF